MAVDLAYVDASGKLNFVPIATLEFFSRVWVRGARELQLPILPTLMHGRRLNADEARTLLLELERLREWAVRTNQDELEPRVATLRSELTRLLEAGHESITTTHGYLEADLTMKSRALAGAAGPSGRAARRYRAPDSLLAFLDGL